jgi:hypothetical protein
VMITKLLTNAWALSNGSESDFPHARAGPLGP